MKPVYITVFVWAILMMLLSATQIRMPHWPIKPDNLTKSILFTDNVNYTLKLQKPEDAIIKIESQHIDPKNLAIARPGITTASWYDYGLPGYPRYSKMHLTAASHEYPRGKKLVVCRADNAGRCVIVRVNDYGPDPKQFPDRQLDLSSLAFSKIADLSEGLVKVKIYVVLTGTEP